MIIYDLDAASDDEIIAQVNFDPLRMDGERWRNFFCDKIKRNFAVCVLCKVMKNLSM